MADRKISQLSTLISLASGDVFVVQDISETGDAANKGITFGDLFGGATSTEVGYLSGVTSNVQTQIDSIESNYVPYTGASSDVDLGSYNLTTTGNITAGNLNISNWDTAYSWGDHSTQGYLTSVSNSDITGLDISELNNDSGYITDYTVTNSDLTGLNNSELTNDAGYITDITGESIGSLSDVDTTGVADGDILKYNGTSGNWEVGTESGGTDGDAIHDNVAGEIDAITNKASPASADLLLIEDSESSYGKKNVKVGDLPTSSGADNTASNIGTDGVGVYDSKDSIDLQFRNIAPASTKISVSLDTTDNDIDLDVLDSNIDHNSLLNYESNEHIDWTAASDNFSTTGNANIDGYIDVGTFANGSEPTASIGRLFYSDEQETLSYYDTNDVQVNIGRDVTTKAQNVSGETINKGEVVYVNGSSGTNPTVTLAQADALSTMRVIGVVMKDSIANNGVGKIALYGRIDGIDTSSFTAGDTLYLSATTAGGLTNTAPSSPNYQVRIGTVISSAVDGILHLDIDREIDITAQELSQLTNIDAVTITNTQWGYLGAMSGQPLEDLSGKTTDDLSEGSTNLYYTDTRVSNNTDVSANTTHRSSNGTDHSYIDQDVTTTANVEYKSVDFNSEYDNGTVSSNTDINWNNGQDQKITLGADITLTFSNMGVGHKQLKVVQDSTGGRTPTLPNGLWPEGTAGTFSTAAGAVDILNIYYDGSTYYYQLATNFS